MQHSTRLGLLGVFTGFVVALCAWVALVPLLAYLAWRGLLEHVAGIHASASGLDLLRLVFGWKDQLYLAWLEWPVSLAIIIGAAALVWGAVVLVNALLACIASRHAARR